MAEHSLFPKLIREEVTKAVRGSGIKTTAIAPGPVVIPTANYSPGTSNAGQLVQDHTLQYPHADIAVNTAARHDKVHNLNDATVHIGSLDASQLPTNLDAATLGGVAAANYALKTDIQSVDLSEVGNANTLDTHHASEFALVNHTHSNVNADTLDGYHASHFMPASGVAGIYPGYKRQVVAANGFHAISEFDTYLANVPERYEWVNTGKVLSEYGGLYDSVVTPNSGPSVVYSIVVNAPTAITGIPLYGKFYGGEFYYSIDGTETEITNNYGEGYINNSFDLSAGNHIIRFMVATQGTVVGGTSLWLNNWMEDAGVTWVAADYVIPS